MREPTVVIGTPRERGAWLLIVDGPQAGRDFRLSSRMVIGSDPTRCDIILNDSTVSGEHARIQREGSVFVIYDLASTNGTFVNGKRIYRHILADEDEITVGRTTLVFKITAKR